jgi:hypothetical protein
MTVEAHMDDTPARLEREPQEQIERLLRTPGLPERARELRDPEARAALAQLARHPAELRTAKLASMAHTPRYNLLGAGMVSYEEGERPRWVLTPLGEQTAEILARGMPQPSDEERRRASARLDVLLAETERDVAARRTAQEAAWAGPARNPAGKLARGLLERLRSRLR